MSTGGPCVTERVARFAAFDRGRSVPTAAFAEARKLIVDNIGVSLGGSEMAGALVIANYVHGVAAAPVSSVVGKHFKTAPQLAALANGTMAHLLTYDETSGTWPSHPSAVLVPTVLAVGEAVQSSGRDVLTALIVGWEVGARIGAEAGHAALEHGWHPVGMIGAVAAACACANLLRLDEDHLRIAIGIAASLGSGLKINGGTDTQPLHAGNAARSGVLAAELAHAGFTANRSALDGPSGLLRALGGDDAAEHTVDALGQAWDIVDPGPTFKVHACATGNHAAVDATLQILAQRRIAADEVAEIHVEAPPAVAVSTKAEPETGLEGKFSLQYSLAAAILDGRAGIAEYTDEAVRRPAARELMKKVRIVASPDGGLSPIRQILRLPQTVSILLTDGASLEARCLHPRGRPENPVTFADLIDKFDRCAGRVASFEQRQRIVDIVGRLEEVEMIGVLGDAASLATPYQKMQSDG